MIVMKGRRIMIIAAHRKEGKASWIFNQRIETLKKLGYSDLEIRQFVSARVTQPLLNLGLHQDTGLIEAPVSSNQSASGLGRDQEL
jgi:hypothetical protein